MPQEQRFYPFRIVWDCEVYFRKNQDSDPTKALQWVASHELLSIASVSNIPNHENAKCWVSEGDSQALVTKFVAELDTQATTANTILLSQNDYVISALNEQIAAESGESNQ